MDKQHIIWVATEGLKFYILLGASFLGIAFIAGLAGYLTQGW